MPARTHSTIVDYDVHTQAQLRKASEVKFPTDMTRNTALIDWAAFEESSGATREWLWTGLLPVVAFFGNFLEMTVHPGWSWRCTIMKALLQNPGSNKAVFCKPSLCLAG